jgi:hypothetical protein
LIAPAAINGSPGLMNDGNQGAISDSSGHKKTPLARRFPVFACVLSARQTKSSGF